MLDCGTGTAQCRGMNTVKSEEVATSERTGDTGTAGDTANSANTEYERALVGELETALRTLPRLLHVVTGPRQVGKTTAVRQLGRRFSGRFRYVSADALLPPGPEWLETHWRLALADATGGITGGADGNAAASAAAPVLLVFDEVQKVRGWSETIKRLWDDLLAREPVPPLHVVLLGSSALLVQHGVTETLAGRFFLHRCLHWTWSECRAAFGWDLETWLFFGGYPGAAPLAGNEQLWRQYVSDSLIETVLARDVFMLAPVAKPALLRHLYGLAATHPAQILSYTKMLGQLQDAGNTTTLANYLHLLGAAFLVSGLEQYSGGQHRRRGSSPKLIFWNNALINAASGLTRAETGRDGAWRGRIVENAVGAHLLNHLHGAEWSLAYWREGDAEADFVVRRGARVWAIEVKSGRPRAAGGGARRLTGLEAFRKKFPDAGALLVGTGGDSAGGIELEEFFGRDPRDFF